VLNIWGHERSGITIDVAKEMQDLRRCMTIFMECEKRFAFGTSDSMQEMRAQRSIY